MSASYSKSNGTSQQQSIYIIDEDNKSDQLLQDNPKLSPHILKKTNESIYSTSRNVSILEVEVNIEAFSFIEKAKNESFPGIQGVKLIPSYFMRTICVTNINELTPLIDVYFALKNLCQDLKNIILLQDPNVSGLNTHICLVEFHSNSSANKALNTINSLNSNSAFGKILNSDVSGVKALWCEPLVDNIKEILKHTPFCYFENLLINNFDLFNFKQFLEVKLLKLNSDCTIKKIRQFANKVLVQFSHNVPVELFNTPFHYENQLVLAIPAMRPNLNVGKYRDRNFKASTQFLNEADKRFFTQRFSENFSSDGMKKKAEGVYSKIKMEEKKEKIREQEKDKMRELEKEREREILREKEKEKVAATGNKRERERVKDNEYVHNRQRDRRDGKDGNDKKKEKRLIDKSDEKMKLASTNIPNLGGANINSNSLSQLTSLLLTNPNSTNMLSGLQNLSVLGNLQNLQNILTNPSMLTMLQQLMMTNAPSATPQIKNIPQTNQNGHSIINTVNMPPVNNQINPIYNVPKTNSNSNIIDQQAQMYYQNAHQYQAPKGFYQNQNNSTSQFPYQMQGMANEMYMSQMPFASMGNMPNMPNMPLQDFGQNNESEMENNLMMKKYYEYYQSMNK